MDIGAIILSGGKSSRFGTDKGLFLFNDSPLVLSSIKVCKNFTDHIIISSNNQLYEQFGFPVVADEYLEKGPMGGIHSALKNSPCDINLVISCDTPFISKELIEMILAEYNNDDVLVTQTIDGKVQTMLGIYHKRLVHKLEENLKNNHLKLISFILETNHRILSIPEKHPFNECFVNFNYLFDLQKYERK